MEAMASRTYDGGKKGTRFIARIVALLALAAVVVGIVVVVSTSMDSSTDTTTAKAQHQSKPKPPAKPADACYTVQSGDTLGSIAAQERPLLAHEIAQRNNMSKQATLQPGQQLNIEPNGCK